MGKTRTPYPAEFRAQMVELVTSLSGPRKGTPETQLFADKLTTRKLDAVGCRGIVGLLTFNPASSSKSSNHGFFPTFDRLPGNHS